MLGRITGTQMRTVSARIMAHGIRQTGVAQSAFGAQIGAGVTQASRFYSTQHKITHTMHLSGTPLNNPVVPLASATMKKPDTAKTLDIEATVTFLLNCTTGSSDNDILSKTSALNAAHPKDRMKCAGDLFIELLRKKMLPAGTFYGLVLQDFSEIIDSDFRVILKKYALGLNWNDMDLLFDPVSKQLWTRSKEGAQKDIRIDFGGRNANFTEELQHISTEEGVHALVRKYQLHVTLAQQMGVYTPVGNTITLIDCSVVRSAGLDQNVPTIIAIKAGQIRTNSPGVIVAVYGKGSIAWAQSRKTTAMAIGRGATAIAVGQTPAATNDEESVQASAYANGSSAQAWSTDKVQADAVAKVVGATAEAHGDGARVIAFASVTAIASAKLS